MRNKLFFFLIMALAVLFLMACQKGQQSGGAKPGISISILDRQRISVEEGTLADNRWTRWINETAPVTVTWVPLNRSESTALLNARFAAGTAPDLVVDYGKVFMDTLYNQGVVQPVGDHIKNYSTSYKQYLDNNPDLLPYLVADDGKQYGMTTRRTALTDLYIFAWYIRNDWLTKFNMPVPSNTDQLISFLRRVRDENPGGDRVATDPAMTWFIQYIYDTKSIFGAPFGDFLVEDGHYVDWTSTPGYRDWLAFWAQLYSEKLIDQEFITDIQTSDRARQYIVTGKAGVYFGQRPSNGDSFMAKELRENVPTADLVTFDPPATSYGKFAMQMQELPNYMVCMNSTAKNPEAIMKYLDWLITDGFMTLTYGTQGTHYRMDNGIPVDISRAAGINDQVSYLSDYAFFNVLNQTPAWYAADVNPANPLSVEFGQKMADWYTLRLNDKPRQYVSYTPSSDTIRRFYEETGASGGGNGDHQSAGQIQQLEIGIIMGRVPLDQGLQMINGLKLQAGWQNIIAEKDAWYQKNKSLFNY